MKNYRFAYKCNNVEYDVYVKTKFQRNIYYRFKDGHFEVSAPTFTSLKTIVKGLDKFAEKLISRFNVTHCNFSFEDDYILLLGEKLSLRQLRITNENELNRFLQSKCKEIIIPLVRKYEEIMGSDVDHKIIFKHTKNQFGSNSLKTKTLSFQIELIHYSVEIIESVVVHEVAHDFQRNHSKKFYDIIYTYFPNYREVQRKLKKGVHV